VDTWVILTMASVGIGFLMFGGAFFGFMSKWPQTRVWALGIGALVMVTIIPVFIALFVAVTGE